MKKSNVLLFIILLLIIGYAAVQQNIGQKIVSALFSKELGIVKAMALSFMEDIAFKDFDKAATYHHPDDRKKSDIPGLIERMFKIKPELLDIMSFEVIDAKLDSSESRARVKLKVKVNILNSGKIKTPEIILYFSKKAGKWYMELESSLKH